MTGVMTSHDERARLKDVELEYSVSGSGEPVTSTGVCRITRPDAPGRIEWSARDGRTFHVDWAFHIAPNGDSTRVVQRARAQPQNFLGHLLLLVLRKRQMPKENARSLLRLKSVAGMRAAPLRTPVSRTG